MSTAEFAYFGKDWLRLYTDCVLESVRVPVNWLLSWIKVSDRHPQQKFIFPKVSFQLNNVFTLAWNSRLWRSTNNVPIQRKNRTPSFTGNLEHYAFRRKKKKNCRCKDLSKKIIFNYSKLRVLRKQLNNWIIMKFNASNYDLNFDKYFLLQFF